VQGDRLVSGLDHGVDAGFGGLPGVRGAPSRAHGVAGDALAPRLEGFTFRRRLHHPHDTRFLRRRADQLARMGAAGLLVGVEQNPDRAGGPFAPVAQAAQRLQRNDDAAFHVQRARPVEDVAFFAQGHRRQRAGGPNRVQVSEHEDRLSGRAVVPAGQADVAHFRAGEHLDGRAEVGAQPADEGADGVGKRLLVRGRFEQHQPLEQRHHLRRALLEIGQIVRHSSPLDEGF